MYALEKILANADIVKLLDHYEFDTSNQNGDMIRSPCMIHGGNNPTGFAINIETTLWYCHTGDCGGGDMVTLVEKMEKVGFVEAVQWLSSFFQIDITGMEIKERQTDLKKDIKKFVKAMTSRKKVKMQEYQLPLDVKTVGKFRNFEKSTLQHFGLMYANQITLKKRGEGEYTLFNRLLFPIIFNYVNVGVAIRRTKSTDFPKWSNQPVNIDTRLILYNYDTAKESREITVVEGITDVWAYHEIGIAAVSTFGAHLTEEQYKLLLMTGADIILSYDGDDAGRIATSKATKMLKNKANIFQVLLPNGSDPESITREELMQLYDNRERR